MAFAIKAEICDPRAKTFAFIAQKTMYGGKHIAESDTVFVFASENEGGQGLIARGVVASAEAIARKRGLARQTPRVSLTIRRTALAKRPLGRASSSISQTGMTASPGPSSISNSIVRPRTRSSASRIKPRPSSANSSSATGLVPSFAFSRPLALSRVSGNRVEFIRLKAGRSKIYTGILGSGCCVQPESRELYLPRLRRRGSLDVARRSS